MEADEDERSRREEQRISRHTFGAIGGPRFTGQRPPPPSYQPPSLHGKHPTVTHAATTTNLYPAPMPLHGHQRRPSSEKPPSGSGSAITDPNHAPPVQPSSTASSTSNSVSMSISIPASTPSGSQRSSPRSPGRHSHLEQHHKVVLVFCIYHLTLFNRLPPRQTSVTLKW